MCWVPIPTAPNVDAPKSDTCKHPADKCREKIRGKKDERNTTDVTRKQSLLNYSESEL